MKSLNIFRRCLVLIAILTGTLINNAQNPKKEKTLPKSDPNKFPELSYTVIPGSVMLGKPQLIMGETRPVMGEGNGWAAPAFFDNDGDGKKDLLIGEFASGVENGGHNYGNLIRAYLNEGDANNPSFSDDFDYVRGYREIGNGTPLSIYNWCCMAFTPRIRDLDGDGYQDIVTGQYNPGFITWFRGSKKGFLPGTRIKEAGDAMQSVLDRTNHSTPTTDITGPNYWTYSAVDFLDADGDGDLDMITGGHALRVGENTGTREKPEFGIRKILLTPDGEPLRMFKTNNLNSTDTSTEYKPESGSIAIPYADDWNNDGITDLLVTSHYAMPGSTAITYFEGVKTSGGLRFKQGVPLFTAANKGKALPGSYPNICVADWNNDGVKDLIIGVNVPTMGGKFDPTLAWSWESVTLKMSPADYPAAFRKYIQKEMEFHENYRRTSKLTDAQIREKGGITVDELYKNYYIDKKYKTLSHKGYIYVMLGQNVKNN